MRIGKDASRVGAKRSRRQKRVRRTSSIYCGDMKVVVARETVECGAAGRICGKCWSRIYSSIKF